MNHGKEIAATVLIGAVVILYFVLYGSLGFILPDVPAVLRIFLGIVGLGLAGGMIKVIIDRIREIRKGEDDDLSNY